MRARARARTNDLLEEEGRKSKKKKLTFRKKKKTPGRLLRPLPVDAHPWPAPLERRHLVSREDDVPGDDRRRESFFCLVFVSCFEEFERGGRDGEGKISLFFILEKKKHSKKKKLPQVSLELALVARFWTWPFAAALFGSYFATWPWLALLPALYRAAGKWDHAQLGVGPNLLTSPLFWLQLALVYAFTFSCRLAEHGGVWVFRPRDDVILAEKEELAERENRGKRGSGGGGGVRKRSRQHAPAAVDVEVEGGRSGEVEVPASAVVFPASSSSPAAAAAPAASSTA